MKNAGEMVSYRSWAGASMMACLTCLLLLVSCNNSDVKDNEGTAEEYEVVPDENLAEEIQVFYQVPSPDEMIAFINQGGYEYNGDILNPVANLESHVDQKSQALNLGMYTADLTYMASYGEFQQSIKYFNAMIKLSESLGISSAFDEQLLSRVKNNLENKDSLENITNSSYYSIVDELERSQRGKTLSMIAAGGWLETVYVVVTLMEEFNPDKIIVQRLADQKLVLENLMLYLGKYESDPAVKATMEDFEKLNEIYQTLEDTPSGVKVREGKGKMILGGDGSIKITRENFDALKDEVIRLRNNIASVNS